LRTKSGKEIGLGVYRRAEEDFGKYNTFVHLNRIAAPSNNESTQRHRLAYLHLANLTRLRDTLQSDQDTKTATMEEYQKRLTDK
jgi:hypothetical protein